MATTLWFELTLILNLTHDKSLIFVFNFHSRLIEGKMRVTRFFILSTFVVLMFGFALSLPTIGDEDPEHGKYIFYIFYTPTKNVLGDTYQKMSGIFYCFTCVTVLSELFFGKTVLTFSFHFLCRLLLTNRPLF